MDHVFELMAYDNHSNGKFYKCSVCGFLKYERIIGENIYYVQYHHGFVSNGIKWIQTSDLTCNEYLMYNVME